MLRGRQQRPKYTPRYNSRTAEVRSGTGTFGYAVVEEKAWNTDC
jgi:hypothetical protein